MELCVLVIFHGLFGVVKFYVRDIRRGLLVLKDETTDYGLFRKGSQNRVSTKSNREIWFCQQR